MPITPGITRAAIEAAQLGDQLALKKLLKGTEYVTRNLVWAWGRPMPADFDDRCQEVRVAIWRKALGKWDPERRGKKSGFKAEFGTHAWWWGRAALKDKIRSDIRRRAHELPASDLRPGGDNADTSKDFDILDAVNYLRIKFRCQVETTRGRMEVRDELFTCIRKLTEQEQRVIYYVFWERMSVREVAEASQKQGYGLEPMGKSKVAEIQRAALERLRGMLVAREVERWD